MYRHGDGAAHQPGRQFRGSADATRSATDQELSFGAPNPAAGESRLVQCDEQCSTADDEQQLRLSVAEPDGDREWPPAATERPSHVLRALRSAQRVIVFEVERREVKGKTAGE